MSNIIKPSISSNVTANGVVIGIKQIERLEDETVPDEEITPERLLQRTRHETEQLKKLAAEEVSEIKRKMMEEYENHQLLLQKMEQELISKMQQEAEIAKKAGFDTGFAEGKTSGEILWREKLAKANDIISMSQEGYNSHIESSERVIVEMASVIARKITGTALQEEEVWIDYVKQLIKEVRETGEIKLYVHPDWYEKTIVHQDELKNILVGTAALYIFPDPSLKEYGCVIESQFGKVDATLDSQLTEIKTALLERLEGSDHEGR